MPLLSTIGAASIRGLWKRGTVGTFITATGGTIYVDPTSANYKIHQFTSNDSFIITGAPIGATMEIMLVAGGGGGYYGGGGGGGYLYDSDLSAGIGTYSVVVGTGGAANVSGTNTTFASIVALGGGTQSTNGGSGGGGVDTNGGTGLQPTSADGGLGNNGGDWTSSGYDGGGGGAMAAGSVPDGGGGKNAEIVSSTGTAAEMSKGGPGNTDSTSTAYTPTANHGGGGTGGGYSGVEFGAGAGGMVRVRYLFQ